MLEDFVKVDNPRLVLDLADDLDALAAGLVQDTPHELHVLARLDKGDGHEVHLVSARKVLQVIDVLVHQHRQVDLDAGQVAVLPLPEGFRVEAGAPHIFIVQDFLHQKDHAAIGEEHAVAGLHRPRQRRVRAADHRLAGHRVLVALEASVAVTRGEHGHLLARVELDVLAAPEHGGADLGALRVDKYSRGAPLLGAHRAEAVEDLLVAGVIAVREVEPPDVAPRVEQGREPFLRPAGRSKRADDLGFAHQLRRVARDHLQRDLGRYAARVDVRRVAEAYRRSAGVVEERWSASARGAGVVGAGRSGGHGGYRHGAGSRSGRRRGGAAAPG